jgi:signal transduction histidine kinase
MDTLMPRSPLGRVLSLLGIVVVAWGLFSWAAHRDHHTPLWVYLCVLVADLAWAGLVVLRGRHPTAAFVCVIVMVVGGGITASAADGIGIVPCAVAILSFTRDISKPLRVAMIIGASAMVIVFIGWLLDPVAPLGLLGIEAGVVVAFLAGESRRQFVLSDQQSRRLLEERSRADLLDARQQIAHDIHDVLAHSLGGLVIQLDAVDALLEAGDTEAAAARVRASRALAAEGLGEARRAVAALQEAPEPATGRVDGARLIEEIGDLLEAHRSMGGEVEFSEAGTRHELGAGLATALRRAVQEGLTNARKHAPGQRVSVRLDWGANDVALRIENAIVTGRASVSAPVSATANSGGGHGLVGMRERFDALPGGVATTAVESGMFVVRAGGATA